jgi:ornithine decarboxylase
LATANFVCENNFRLNLQAEISKVLQLGVDASKIIFANPVKQASHIRYAANTGVATMTFDNETELHKIKSLYPNAK